MRVFSCNCNKIFTFEDYLNETTETYGNAKPRKNASVDMLDNIDKVLQTRGAQYVMDLFQNSK